MGQRDFWNRLRELERGWAQNRRRSSGGGGGDQPSTDAWQERLQQLAWWSSPPTSSYGSNDPNAGEYIVKAGDSYSSVAAQFYGDERAWVDIQRANPNMPRLHPDMKIILPGRSESTLRPAPSQTDFWKEESFNQFISDEASRQEELADYNFNYDRYEALTQVERKPLVEGKPVYYGYDPETVNPETNDPGMLFETSDPAGAQLFWDPEGNEGEGGVVLDSSKLPPAWGLPRVESGQPYIHGIQDQNRLGSGLHRAYYDINPEVRNLPVPPPENEMRQNVLENDLNLLNQKEQMWNEARRDMYEKNPELKALPQDKIDEFIIEEATRLPSAVETASGKKILSLPLPSRAEDADFSFEIKGATVHLKVQEITLPFNDKGGTQVYGVSRDDLQEMMPIFLKPAPIHEAVSEAGNIIFDESINQYIGTRSEEQRAEIGAWASIGKLIGEGLLSIPRTVIGTKAEIIDAVQGKRPFTLFKETAEYMKARTEGDVITPGGTAGPQSSFWKEVERTGNNVVLLGTAVTNPALDFENTLTDENKDYLLSIGFVFEPTEGVSPVWTLGDSPEAQGVDNARSRLQIERIKEVQPLRQEAESTYRKAFLAQEDGDHEKAFQLSLEAQAADAKSRTVQNPWYTYTWGARPDLEEKFLTSAALISLQLGRPLTDREVQMIRMHYEDLAVELPMRMALDLSNFIPLIPWIIDGLRFGRRGIARGLRFIDDIQIPGTAHIFDSPRTIGTLLESPSFRFAARAGEDMPPSALGKAISWLAQDTPHVAGRRIGTQATNSVLRLNLPFARVADLPSNLPAHFSLEGHLDIIGKYISGGKPTSGPVFDAWNALPISSKTNITESLEKLFRVYDPLLDNQAMNLINPENAGNFVRKAIREVTQAETARLWGNQLEKLDAAIDKARRISDETARAIAVAEAEELKRIAMATQGSVISAQAESLARKPGQLAQTIGKYFRAASDASNSGRMGISDRAITGFFNSFSDNVKFIDLSPHLQASVLMTAKGANKWINKAKGWWFTGVLSSVPRWTINNIVDSAFRMMSAGGHLTDNLQDNLKYALKHGIMEEELMTTFVSYARGGSDLNVPGELVRAILAAEEGQKLHLMLDVVRPAIMEAAQKNPQKAVFLLPEALNQYFEFSYRLRLHKRLFEETYRVLDDIALHRVLMHLEATGATDVAREAFKAAWKAAGTDPTKLEDLMGVLSGGARGQDVVARISSLKFPEGIEGMMNAAGIKREVQYSLLDVLAERLETSIAGGSGTVSGKLESMHTTLDDLVDEIDADLLERLKDLDDAYKPYGDLSVDDARKLVLMIREAGDDVDELRDVARVANVDTEFVDEITDLARNAPSVNDEETLAKVLQNHVEYTVHRDVSDHLARTLSGGVRTPVEDVRVELEAAGLSERMIDDIFARRTLTGRARRLRKIWRQEQLTGDLEAVTQRLMTVEVPDPMIRAGQVVAGEGNEAVGLSDDVLVGNIGQRIHPPDPHAQAGIEQAARRFDAEEQIRAWNDEVTQLSEAISRGEDVEEAAQQMALVTRKSAYVQSAIERSTFVRDKVRRFGLETFPGPLVQDGVGRERAFDIFFGWDEHVYRGIGRMIEDARALADSAAELDQIPARYERTLNDFLTDLNVRVHWRDGRFNGLELQIPGGQPQWTHLESRVTDDLLGRFFPESSIRISDAEAILNKSYTTELVAEVLEGSVRLDRQIDDAVRAADVYYTGALADAPDLIAFPHQIEEARRLSLDWGDGTVFKVRDAEGVTEIYGRIDGEWRQFDAALTPVGDAIEAGSNDIAELIVRGRVTTSPEFGELSQVILRDLMELDNAMFKAAVEENDWATKFGEDAVRDRNSFVNYIQRRIDDLAGGGGRDAYVGPLYSGEIATAEEVAEARRLSDELPVGTTIEELNDSGSVHYWRKTEEGWQEIGGSRFAGDPRDIQILESGDPDYGLDSLRRLDPRTVSDVTTDAPSISKMADGSYRRQRVPSRIIYVTDKEDVADAVQKAVERSYDPKTGIYGLDPEDVKEIVVRPTKKSLRSLATAKKKELVALGFDKEEVAEYVGTVRNPGIIRVVTAYGDTTDAVRFMNRVDEAVEFFKKSGDLDDLKNDIKALASEVNLYIPPGIADNLPVKLGEIPEGLLDDIRRIDVDTRPYTPPQINLAEERRTAVAASADTLGVNVVDPESDDALRLLLLGQEVGEPAPLSTLEDLENILHDIQLARRDVFRQARAMGIESSWLFSQEGQIRVPRYQLPDFVRTRYEHTETAVGQAQASKNFLRNLRPMLRSKIEAGDIGFTRLLAHDRTPIRDISELAITTKTSIKSTALRGLDDGMFGVSDEMKPFIDELYDEAIGRGIDLTGSLPRTNKSMIDYAAESNFDSIMRNVFPFWRFQSRSPVYWAGWFAKHPWAASAYFKHLKYSRVSQIEAGQVNLKGEPAYPAGYIRLPYTDTWVNPLAPLSFRVIFPTRPAYTNAGAGSELITFITKWASVYGMSPAPWWNFAFNKLGWLDQNLHPPMSLVPILDLVPIYWQRAIENTFNRMERPIDGPRWGAESPWLDGQIENQMRKDALEEMRENPERAQAVLIDLGRALGYRPRGKDEFGAPIWNEAQYDPVRTHPRWEEAQLTIETIGLKSKIAGYMAGAYFRTWTDEDAEMRALELEANFLSDAINNEAAANYFALDPRPERRYEIWKANNYGASPEELMELGLSEEQAAEGRLASLGGSLRWVTAPEGERLFGVDRREQIVQDLHARQVTSAYFDSVAAADARLVTAQGNLPTGAGREMTDPLWVQWKEERDAIDANPIFAAAEIPSFKIGLRPEVMLEEHYLEQQMWTLNASRSLLYDSIAADSDPDYYLKYQLDIRVWETVIFPTLQATVDEAIAKQVQTDIDQYERGLPGDQDLNPALMGKNVSKQITLASYYEWKKNNDNIYEAADNVWQEDLLDVWWDEVGSLSGIDRELAQREWDIRYPTGTLTLDDYVAGIQERYGDKWTEGEIREKLGPRESLTIEDRLGAAEGSPEEKQEIGWDLLMRVPPGSIARKDLSAALIAVGGDPDQLQTWYDTGGEWMFAQGAKANAKAQQFLIDLDAAIKNMNLPNPSTETLEEWKQVRELDTKFKARRDQLLTQYHGPEWNDLMQHYFNLPSRSAERRKFNKDHPGLVDDYYQLRCDFGAAYELWAYYNLTEDDCKDKGGGGSGGGQRSSRSRGRGGGGGGYIDRNAGFIPAGYRSSYEVKELFDPLKVGTGGVGGVPYWPPGFGAKTPDGVLKDIVNRTEKNEPVSDSTKTYLKNTADQKEKQVEKYLSIAAPGSFDFRAWLDSIISDKGEVVPVRQLYGGGRDMVTVR